MCVCPVYQDLSTVKNQAVARPGLLVRDLSGDATKTIAYKAPQGGVSDLEGLAFSPDGNTIVGASQSFLSALQIIVWQGKGDAQRRVYPYNLHRSLASKPWFLQWTPDGSAYMVDANMLFDHSSGRMLWVLENSEFGGIGKDPWRFLDNDNLLICERRSIHRRLVTVPVPWKDIRASQAAMASDRPAYLKPGDKIAIDLILPKPAAVGVGAGDLNAAPAPGNAAYVAIQTALTERLKLEGFVVEQDAPTRFFVRYRAGGVAAEAQPPSNGGDAADRPPKPASLELGWRSGNQVLWRIASKVGAAKLLAATDEGGRLRSPQLIIGAFNRSIMSKTILPYYIPRDKNLSMLPIYSRN